MLLVLRIARRGAAAALGSLTLLASGVSAQRKPGPEFTKQSVLVSNFRANTSTGQQGFTKNDLRFGRRVGDAVRDRLGDRLDKREAAVIHGADLRAALVSSAFSVDTVFSIIDLRQQGQFFRVDEIVVGSATQSGKAVRVDATLVLWRDTRLRQPIPAVSGKDLDAAVNLLADRINAARGQLKHQRRCENALRDGQGTRAVQSAREGISQYPNGALVRTCLVWALRAMGAPADQILAEAMGVLNIDAEAPHGLEAAAMALDSLRRRPEAAEMWLRLAATDSNNLELAERILWSMAEGGNSRRAEPLVVSLSERYPDTLRLTRQKWRIANDNRNWSLAIAAGETLLARDSAARADSIFYLRLATAYKMNAQPFKAIEIVARGVTAFPNDPRLYALYTQFVKQEADTVIGRGLALYPNSGELLALNAKELRARGRVAEALDASKKAVELDSTISQGRLLIAQTEIDLGQPDSALITLHRAVEAGEDLNTVAQLVLSKGNSFLRAANGTKARADFQLAMRYLAFADTLKSTPQTKFLLGAAALSVAQTALTEAPKITAREESCVVSQLGADTIPIARASLEAGEAVSPEATKQFLEYLDVISPYADKQIAAFCGLPAPPAKKDSTP